MDPQTQHATDMQEATFPSILKISSNVKLIQSAAAKPRITFVEPLIARVKRPKNALEPLTLTGREGKAEHDDCCKHRFSQQYKLIPADTLY
jgi:hypothetical protein